MIVTKEVDVTMGGKNIKHYKSLGYDVKLYQTITVPIEHLSLGSHCIIEVCCDYCGTPVLKVYKTLMNERKDAVTKKDCCENCIHKKTEETNLLLYGVKNCMEREEVKEKLKEVFFEKYGVEYITQNEEIKDKVRDTFRAFSEEQWQERSDKSKKTTMERYGAEHYTQTEEYKERYEKTCIDKYGVSCVAKAPSVRKKYKETMQEKYGVDNYFQTDEFKENVSNYYMENFSVPWFSQTDSFKEKMKKSWADKTEDELSDIRRRTEQTNLEKYGVACPLNLKSSRDKLLQVSKSESCQQATIFSILKDVFKERIEPNVLIAPYTLDMVIDLNNKKIDLEYDCSYWHYPDSDNRRDEFLQSSGFIIFRIKSGKLVPDIDKLIEEIISFSESKGIYKEMILKDWDEEQYNKRRGE
jgi:very-short-patch-repair endonuclease